MTTLTKIQMYRNYPWITIIRKGFAASAVLFFLCATMVEASNKPWVYEDEAQLIQRQIQNSLEDYYLVLPHDFQQERIRIVITIDLESKIVIRRIFSDQVAIKNMLRDRINFQKVDHIDQMVGKTLSFFLRIDKKKKG